MQQTVIIYLFIYYFSVAMNYSDQWSSDHL